MPRYSIEINDFSRERGIEALEIASPDDWAAVVARELAADPSYVFAVQPESYPALVLFDRDGALPHPDEDVEAYLLGNVVLYDFERS